MTNKEFILNHQNDDIASLRLKFHGKCIDGVDLPYALTQIEARRKARTKLKKFIASGGIFPDTLAAEQATHECVATLHADIIESLTPPQPSPQGREQGYQTASHQPSTISCQPSTLVDLTAGLGVDVFAAAEIPGIDKIIAVEMNPQRAETLRKNVAAFGLEGRIEVVEDDCRNIIDALPQNCIVFADPARRDSHNGRIYSLRDSLPDIVGMAPDILRHAKALVVKGSPMLDVTQSLRDLPAVRHVAVVSVNSECKEALLVASTRDNVCFPTPFSAYLIHGDTRRCWHFHEIATPPTRLTDNEKDIRPGMYMHEPDAAIMKLSPWRELCQQYPSLMMASRSTPLFFSEDKIEDFPGRVFAVEQILNSKILKQLRGKPFNVATRNYPLSADQLRAKLRTASGNATDFIFGLRAPGPLMLRATRVTP